MPDKRHFAHAIPIAGAALAVFAAECGLVYGYFAGGFASWFCLCAHGAIAMGLAVWCWWSSAQRADVRLTLLLAAATAALGPVGPAGTLVTMCLARWFMRRAIPFEEWYRSLFPDSDCASDDELAVRLAAADATSPGSLTPFAEVLTFGSTPQKQALVALITQHFRPAFGPILKRALSDENQAVRVQAATAMNRLENVMLERTLELSRRAKENPGDVHALSAIARHYDDYLYCGILDARREEEIRARALEAYKQCLAVWPGDLDCRLAEGRLLLRAKRYAEAAECFEQAMGAGLSTPQAGLWYMESLYRLGRFDQLRAFARSQPLHLPIAGDLPPAAAEVIELWTDDKPSHEGEAVAQL